MKKELWYAVYKDGSGFIYNEKPVRSAVCWVTDNNFYSINSFGLLIYELPNITFSDEPIKITIEFNIN